MPQPIPKKIIKSNPEFAEKQFNTLLIDGSNLLEISSVDKRFSSNGEEIGGAYQFLLQMKILLQKGNFRYVYVFWDGDNSGEYRACILPSYKANRNKNYDLTNGGGELSDYMKAVNEKIRQYRRHFMETKQKRMCEEEERRKIMFKQREVIMQCLEELFVRQCVCDKIEADDLIAYYVKHKKKNERIVIVSNDRDLTQLIDDDVIIYVQALKKFINKKNHTEEFGYYYENVLLKKMICGDYSDNIKGVKGVGEGILLKQFPEIKSRRMTLEEVVDRCRVINEKRSQERKKPLLWAYNLEHGVTVGEQGDRLYEINRKIIDLKNPIMSEEAKTLMDMMMYAPIDPEGRSFDNLYKILKDNGIDELTEENKFSNFFVEFKYLIEKEKKNT